MGIGSVTSMNSMSGMQMTMTSSIDSKSKSIQNEITSVQQQIQKLSSQDDLSVDEKANEKKKLQNEMSSLNMELKLQQEEFRRSQRREIMMAELQEDKGLAKEEKSEDASVQQTEQKETGIDKNKESLIASKEELSQSGTPGVNAETKQADEANGAKEEAIAEKETKAIDNDMDKDTGISGKEMHALVAADNSLQQADRLGTVIARIKDGIVILKGEIDQDEKRGVDTEKKEAELEQMEKREQRATSFQFSVLGEANNTMQAAAKTKVSGIQDQTQTNTENNAFQLFNEADQASQQMFYVSLGH